MSPQTCVLLLLFLTTTKVLIAQIVNYGFERRPELMANDINYNLYFLNRAFRNNTKHGIPGMNKISVPYLRNQAPLQTVNKKKINNFVDRWPNLVHKQHFPSSIAILRDKYSGLSQLNRRQDYVDYYIPYNRFKYRLPSIATTTPTTHSTLQLRSTGIAVNLRNTHPHLQRLVPDSTKIDNRNGNNEVKIPEATESLILRRPGSTLLSDNDKKSEVIYTDNNRQIDFLQHVIEKKISPTKPITHEKKFLDNGINIHLQQHKTYEEVVSTTEHIIMKSVDFTYVTPKRVTPETDVYIYKIDDFPINNRNMDESEPTEKEEITTPVITINIAVSPCCSYSNEINKLLNNIPEHADTKDKLLKVMNATKEGFIGSNVSPTSNKNAKNSTTEPIKIIKKVTTPIMKNISEAIASIKKTEKPEPAMEVTATEAYTKIVPKQEFTLEAIDESETNTIEESSVIATPTVNQHTFITSQTIESKNIVQTINDEPYKKVTANETINSLATKQDMEESVKMEINSIEDNNAHNFTSTDHASITPHLMATTSQNFANSNHMRTVKKGETTKKIIYDDNEVEINLTDNGGNSPQYSKIREQKFVYSLEQLERRFHETKSEHIDSVTQYGKPRIVYLVFQRKYDERSEVYEVNTTVDFINSLDFPVTHSYWTYLASKSNNYTFGYVTGKLYNPTNFNILSTLAPEERRESGISFLQSGFLLLIALTALSTTVDEPTRKEIADFSLYAGTDQEKANAIRSILEWLPKTDSNLTIRWSNRLVLAPGYNLSEVFWRRTAKNMKMHVDFLNDTSDLTVLTKTLNHLVETDSGGTMRDDTFYEEELSSNVRCVLLSTLYIRARWRVGPTLLNGTRRFYDASDHVRTTPMVRINDVVKYAHVERWDADAVEVSYATAGLTLLILVPRGRSLRALTGHVVEEGLRNIVDSMATRRIAVTLPVYTLRMSLLLPNKLQNMGVKTLTEGKDQQIRLSHAVQRLMYWSEAGRNAFKDDGLEWDESPEMELIVDRPYLFFVRWHNITLLNGNFVL